MSTTTFRCFAKINLHLRVMGRRDDGYHELLTIFQSVDLADLLTLELTGPGVRVEVSAGGAPPGRTNLAYRAAEGFLQRWAPELGATIGLDKRIPVGGGLGGGSSDAATVLLGLQRLTGKPETRGELMELAGGLGADVPYFLFGGTALGRGRGDRIRPLSDLEEREIWLVTPPVEISTGAVFTGLKLESLAASTVDAEQILLRPPRWSDLSRWHNDLEATVMARFPAVRDVYNVLVEAGATLVRLSGTGATLFAFFDGGSEPVGLAAELPPECRIVRTKTLTRSSLDRRLVVQ